MVNAIRISGGKSEGRRVNLTDGSPITQNFRLLKITYYFSLGKIAEKAVCRSVFDNMALYFECRINKNALLQNVFFGDFAHWVMSIFLF